jgi:peptidyl-tRNA hydrolase
MPSDKNQMADFVLSPFALAELPIVSEMIPQARDACLFALTDGLAQAMNVFNKRTAPEDDTPHQ